jgi:hypothetical protein
MLKRFLKWLCDADSRRLEEENYLSQSVDMYDLERRQRELMKRGYYY